MSAIQSALKASATTHADAKVPAGLDALLKRASGGKRITLDVYDDGTRFARVAGSVPALPTIAYPDGASDDLPCDMGSDASAAFDVARTRSLDWSSPFDAREIAKHLAKLTRHGMRENRPRLAVCWTEPAPLPSAQGVHRVKCEVHATDSYRLHSIHAPDALDAWDGFLPILDLPAAMLKDVQVARVEIAPRNAVVVLARSASAGWTVASYVAGEGVRASTLYPLTDQHETIDLADANVEHVEYPSKYSKFDSLVVRDLECGEWWANATYLKDADAFVGDGATLKVLTGLRPGVLESADGTRRALVMPVRPMES